MLNVAGSTEAYALGIPSADFTVERVKAIVRYIEPLHLGLRAGGSRDRCQEPQQRYQYSHAMTQSFSPRAVLVAHANKPTVQGLQELGFEELGFQDLRFKDLRFQDLRFRAR